MGALASKLYLFTWLTHRGDSNGVVDVHPRGVAEPDVFWKRRFHQLVYWFSVARGYRVSDDVDRLYSHSDDVSDVQHDV